MQASTAISPPMTAPYRSRRPRRLGIDAHTEFVSTLVSELDSAMTRMRAALRSLGDPVAAGEVVLSDPAAVERPAEDMLRLVRLLEAIDGPADRRHLELTSLPDLLEQAAKSLDIEVSARGEKGRRPFLGDVESMLLGMELVLQAFEACSTVDGQGEPVTVGISDDRLVVVGGGSLDLSDERAAWHLRCGRRVLEGQNCRVRLIAGRGGYRLEIRALES
jgi:hypothetical protein